MYLKVKRIWGQKQKETKKNIIWEVTDSLLLCVTESFWCKLRIRPLKWFISLVNCCDIYSFLFFKSFFNEFSSLFCSINVSNFFMCKTWLSFSFSNFLKFECPSWECSLKKEKSIYWKKWWPPEKAYIFSRILTIVIFTDTLTQKNHG